ncbi:MAG TPA: hypothetical protein VHA15_12865 [Burkholderiales bacterium]|jgi:hypothetical protein|nr:hypothetical protein [Burkholderiales bacterium]
MDHGLPFPIEIVFLLIVLPVAFAYLGSVAGVAWLALRKAWNRLVSRENPPQAPNSSTRR